ncbi:hypothetical protein RHSIM_Rhsim02G0117800 [Rhododendron simsii]|uniref:Protein FAR1-RELATED SEQUENCE n=1 Tax=Rhododendron simsii TaxID=118357 RepID=A0A834LZD5_RHOSS|nr:hypothetical protein RHSIM_Rhsim02G0117800 [Rhododendron simsii]
MEFQDPSPEINEDIKAILIMDCEDLVLEEDQNLEEVPEPKIGMFFDSKDDARDCYGRYAKVQGFVVVTRTSNKHDGISKFEIEEDIKVGEKGILKTVTFHVCYNEESKESNCTCRLFESKGIVCKHIVMVWSRKKLNEAPEKYILPRWSKNVRRSHTMVKVSYANWERKPEWRRYDYMLVAFRKAAEKAMDSEAKSKRWWPSCKKPRWRRKFVRRSA